MPDREKVIKGLECCSLMDGHACSKCPYSSECVAYETEYQTGTAHLAADALALLKDQEPVSPIDENYWNHTLGRCGHCKAPLPAIEGLRSKFCWMCGKAVKWE